MTAKEALLVAVEGMSEADAQYFLALLHRPPVRPFPSPLEMMEMPDEELDAIFARFPPETDLDELELWEQGTGEDLERILDADDEAD